MTTRPNLFDYATKELSQDAVICWLLMWAASERRKTDSALCDTGCRLVKALLAKHGISPLGEVKTVEVWQQRNRIDVLALINDTHLLLIEDKTTSGDHSDQLRRYYDAVRSDDNFGRLGENIYPVYFKTGNYQLHEERHRIERGKPHYRFFDRRDFLDVLEGYTGNDHILTDYCDHLQRLEKNTNSYTKWEKEQHSNWSSWEGFFMYLERSLSPPSESGNPGWGYVANPTGGFLGLWWGWRNLSAQDHEGARAYMQLEVRPDDPSQQNLCFKVAAYGAATSVKDTLKGKYHERIMKAGGDRVRRPVRLRRGDTMTVAVWEPSWLVFGAGGKLDIEKTVSCLQEAEEVLERAVSAR